jgi:hypothetical protein
MTHLMIVVYFTAQEGLLGLEFAALAACGKSTTSKRWVARAWEGIACATRSSVPRISVKLMSVCNRQFRLVAMIACDSATTGDVGHDEAAAAH